jgi:F-type H+-transporting ATPase subunit gamma
MASAMKTAATVKYAKISRELVNIEDYSLACSETLTLFGDAVLTRSTNKISSRNCLVLFSNNRGFCGGFNGELLRFFETRLAAETEPPMLLVLGQKGIAFCKSKNLEFESLPFNDIPSYKDAETMTERLFGLYADGTVNRIDIIYQFFKNMMVQVPTAETILPHPVQDTELKRDLLFLPDKETAMLAPAMYCLINSIYGIMLSHSAGIQAATTIAMRSACDNAEKSLEKLETLINRIRQAEVTNSVIETSSYINFE